MKIKTHRLWHLIAVRSPVTCCIDIREVHDGSPDDGSNHIVVPHESIPELIEYLTKVLKKRGKK